MGIHPELPFHKYVQLKHLRKVIPHLAKTCQDITERLTPAQYNKAVLTANNIARRGRSSLDYYYLLQTAALNFLRFEHLWFRKEIDDLKCFLVEQSFIRHKSGFYALKTADEYLCYMFPRLMGLVYTMHRDHTNPKGLATDVQDTILTAQILPRPTSPVLYEDEI